MENSSDEDFDQYNSSDSEDMMMEEDSDSSIEMATSQNKITSSVRYEIMSPQAVLNYLQGKVVELARKFDYSGLSESYFLTVLRQHFFMIEEASTALGAEGIILADMERLRRTSSMEIEEGVCMIDYMPIEKYESFTADCSHTICQECYECYLQEKISSGPGCIFACCPQLGCSSPISLDLVNKVCKEKESNLYKKFLLADFVSKSANMIPCTRADCKNTYMTVEKSLLSDQTLPQQNAVCLCGNINCLRCGQAGHEPLNCSMYKEWMDSVDEMLDKLNSSWKKKFTKECPKCKVGIQKNQGCMHMTCVHCRHHFCWLCLQDWKVKN